VSRVHFAPERLAIARARRRCTKVELAKRIGMSSRRVAAFENEGAEPPAETIERIAQALQFPVAFFYRPGPARTLASESISFRSFSRMAARDRDAALAAFVLAAEVSAWFDRQFHLPEPALPDLRGMDPSAAATALRTSWDLGDGPAPNMVHLLEARGVRVFSLTHDCAALDALSGWVGGVPYVFLGTHKSAERARWDAAHEVGHLLLHHHEPPRGRAHEDEADVFAAEFLLPERGLRPTIPRVISLHDVRHQKVTWRVSVMAWIRRVFQLGGLTEWAYRTLVIEASQAGLRSREDDIERETSQLFPKALLLLESEGTTVADLARELALPKDEVRDLLFQPSTIDGGGEASPSSRPSLRVIEGDRT
jgi:Zn-dependent peptidase ImmA (M78 family)/transcriptional regulator with XRE-family HTH domain